LHPLSKRHSVPPWALAVAMLAHGASWLLLAAIAFSESDPASSAAAIAWIHLVALGWFSVAALAILLHVIPGSTSLDWQGESAARAGLAVMVAGVVIFDAAWLTDARAVAPAAALLLLGIALYLVSALRTLAAGTKLGRRERAISRALSTTLDMFGLVALLGFVMALSVSGYVSPRWLVALPAAHANLGVIGWLTLLVVGISARTMQPICGIRSPYPRLHIVVGTTMLPGALLLALGLAIPLRVLIWIGALLVGIGAIAYAFDIVATLTRSTVTHRPPQAFVAASIFWLLFSLALGAGTLIGGPWASAYVFAMLIGWIGQMVNAQMLHIGARVIARRYRGEDDETRPGALLDARLSWIGFGAMQAATLLCVAGLANQENRAVFAGAVVGLLAWCVLVADAAVAVKRSRRPGRYSPAHATR
jgi:hypothetical protein